MPLSFDAKRRKHQNKNWGGGVPGFLSGKPAKPRGTSNLQAIFLALVPESGVHKYVFRFWSTFAKIKPRGNTSKTHLLSGFRMAQKKSKLYVYHYNGLPKNFLKFMNSGSEKIPNLQQTPPQNFRWNSGESYQAQLETRGTHHGGLLVRRRCNPNRAS